MHDRVRLLAWLISLREVHCRCSLWW